MPPKKLCSHSQVVNPQPEHVLTGSAHPVWTMGMLPPKARRVHPKQQKSPRAQNESPQPSFFDLLPLLLVEDARSEISTGPSSQCYVTVGTFTLHGLCL
jgi:hypothetical protein